MGGLLTWKRVIAGAVAVIAAGSLVAGTAWLVRGFGGGGDAVDAGEADPMAPEAIEPVAAKDIHDVSITMDVPTYSVGQEVSGSTMEVIVDNGAGEPLHEVALDVIIDEPDGDWPLMAVVGHSASCEYAPEYDDPDSEWPNDKYVDEECVQQQRKGKQGCTLTGLDEGEGPATRHSRCVQTLKEGENVFGFDLEIQAETAAEIRDYPTVAATARLSVGDEEFASTEDQVKTKYPKEWDRVKFDDFPKVIDTDRTESKPYHWSITVTNDTGKALTDATALIYSSNNVTSESTGIDSDRPGCHREDDDPTDNRLTCDGIDLPAGGTLTIPMTAYFAGDVDKLKKKTDCRDAGDDCTFDELAFSIANPDERQLAATEATTTIRLAG